MRHFLSLLSMLLISAWSGGCAQTGACPEGEALVDGVCTVVGNTRIISLGCRNSVTDVFSQLEWELTVNPVLTESDEIESGEPFTATLDGVAVFSEAFLDAVQTPPFERGLKEANLVDLNATVQVRSGATGANVTLTSEPIPYECFLPPRTECDPANDLPSIPGRRGNTDCQPEDDLNPCGRFVPFPTSANCAPGGVCDELGKTGPDSQCENNGFCITGDVQLPLKREFGEYAADPQGTVLFGWADESTGATIERMPGAADPIGPIGLRIGVGPLLIALECVMPDGTPDEALVSFPIDMP